MTENIRVRFAPSPTGHLHIGGARSALFNYLYARKLGGKFILRFEDTDQKRHVPEAEAKMMESMRWLGLTWDEGPEVGGSCAPYRSSERLASYMPYVEQLLDSGQAYRCYCSQEEIETERQKMLDTGQTPKYSGKCRNLTPEQEQAFKDKGRSPVVRFLVPNGILIKINDMVRGEVSFESDGIGDFVIVKSDGMPVYNLACTIDDYLMKITDVIRGEEHLSNTPRQMLIYKAFKWSAPRFAHISLILNQERQKMSKRDESIIQFVEQYAQLGFLPEALVNFLALLGWSPPGEEELFTMEQLIAAFSMERVAKNPAVFDPDKLNWMNNHYLKQADGDRLLQLTKPHFANANILKAKVEGASTESDAWFKELIMLYIERTNYLAELPQLVKLFFTEQVEYDDEAKAVLTEEQSPQVLHELVEQFQNLDVFDVENIQASIKAVQKNCGVKGKQLFMPIRAAVTGTVHGPDLNKSLSLLGKNKVIDRIQEVISNI